MTHILENILNDFGVTSTFSKLLFIEKTTINEYAKSTDIFVEGKRNELEYLLISGVLHRFNISDKGEIVTTGFYMPKSIITPHFARTNKGKNIFTLQTLTDAVIAEISVKDLDNLRSKNNEFHDFLCCSFFHVCVLCTRCYAPNEYLETKDINTLATSVFYFCKE